MYAACVSLDVRCVAPAEVPKVCERMQNIMNPVTAVSVVVFLISPPLFWLLTEKLQLGLVGAAAAMNVTAALTAGLMICTAAWSLGRCDASDPKRTAWSGFSTTAFSVRQVPPPCTACECVFVCSRQLHMHIRQMGIRPACVSANR